MDIAGTKLLETATRMGVELSAHEVLTLSRAFGAYVWALEEAEIEVEKLIEAPKRPVFGRFRWILVDFSGFLVVSGRFPSVFLLSKPTLGCREPFPVRFAKRIKGLRGICQAVEAL